MKRAFAAALLCLLLPLACQAEEWRWPLPSYVPQPRIPADNPMSKAKIELGRQLFFDARLSGNASMSCASCHLQNKAFSDGRAVPLGSTGDALPRNAPGLFNLAWITTYTWANPALLTLERQMEVPLFAEDPVEMGVNDGNRDEVLARFRNDPAIRRKIAQAFPDSPDAISFDMIVKAIAAFERSIISFNAKYDHVQQGTARFSPAEKRGRDLFFEGKDQCQTCHGGFNFNDQVTSALSEGTAPPFHNVAGDNPDFYAYPNRGLFEFTGQTADMGKFRAPSLRNIALTAPYMHDGRAKTIEAALALHRIALSPKDTGDLVAFLKTLTDETLLSAPAYGSREK